MQTVEVSTDPLDPAKIEIKDEVTRPAAEAASEKQALDTEGQVMGEHEKLRSETVKNDRPEQGQSFAQKKKLEKDAFNEIYQPPPPPPTKTTDTSTQSIGTQIGSPFGKSDALAQKIGMLTDAFNSFSKRVGAPAAPTTVYRDRVLTSRAAGGDRPEPQALKPLIKAAAGPTSAQAVAALTDVGRRKIEEDATRGGPNGQSYRDYRVENGE
jgi:hypothetical protein